MIVILAVISFILLIVSFIKKDKQRILLNLFNLILTVFYINFQSNFLENKYNESFSSNSVINGEKFYQYLGLHEIGTVMLIIIIQLWFMNLVFLRKRS